MVPILLDRPTESEDSDMGAALPIVVTGPDGVEYDVTLPEGATPAEVAAIAASVSAALSSQAVSDDHTTDEPAFDAWNWRGRIDSTGRRIPPAGSAPNTWKYAGRPGLF